MTPASSSAFRALAAAALVLAMAAPAARGQGIDLVFLVDVSGSMFHDPNRPSDPTRPGGLNGNDIQRIRWDAVLLSLNLLGAEDRVLVIPFNQDAPALTEYIGFRKDQQYPVPGRLPANFFHPRLPEERGVREQIVSFAHEGNPDRPNANNEWNGDVGGTAILLALEKAKSALAGSPPDRKRFVILLTDGHEASTNKPERFEEGNVNGWIDTYADLKGSGPKTKVYTIGLGNQVDVDLLETIATKTGGHYEPAASNGALIDVFRTLIWQLKGCWTKPKPIAPAANGSENDLMSGISDLGILSYRIGPAQGSRNYFALGQTEGLAFVWKGASGAPLKTVGESFHSARDEPSYTYAYYDPKGLQPEDRLVSIWERSDGQRMLWFSKHTNRPLFKIVEQSRGTFQRFEAMRVSVHMDELPPIFESSKFALSAILKATDDKSPIKPLGPLPFTYDPKAKQFQYEFDLSRVASAGKEIDRYSLAVTARGKPTDQDHSLRDYELQLPPVDVQVVNRLRLQDPGTVTIGTPDNKRVETIKLRPAGSKPFQSPQGMAPIALKVTPERNTAAARPSESAELRVNEFGHLEGDLSFTFADNAPEGLYEGGVLRVTSDKTEPLLVRYQVAVRPKRLGFNRSPIKKIEFRRGEAVPSETLQVFLDEKPVPPEPARVFAVSIPKGPSFGTEELWLVKDGQAGTKGQQSLTLGPNESFHVMFNPSNDHEPGLYTFRLVLAPAPDARGHEYGAEEGVVKLDYMAPTIGLEKPAVKYVQLGQSLVQELQVKLEGAEAKRKVFFRTFSDVKRGIAGPPEFEARDPRAPAIELEAIDDPKEMTAASPPKPQPLRVRITAPPKIDCGQYTLSNGYLAADKTDRVGAPLSVQVNDLKLTDENGHDLNGPLIFYPIRGWALTRKVRVFAAFGALGVDEVSVEDGDSFLNPLNNVSKPNLHIERAPPRTVKGSDGRSGVELSLTVEHPEPSFEPYSGSLVIRCEGQKLRKDLACVVQWVEVLQTRETASGKKPARER